MQTEYKCNREEGKDDEENEEEERGGRREVRDERGVMGMMKRGGATRGL